MTFVRACKLGCGVVAAVLLTACSHPIVITPDIAKIERPADAKPRVKANVGYYVDAAQREQERITPGGGGDKVSTKPYRDLEVGFYKMLTNVYENVTTLKSPSDQQAIQQNALNYIVKPRIEPNSSSSSMMTWPPTYFTVDLVCEISDTSGRTIDTKRVVGKGNAEFSEFKNDFGLSGKLAMQDALLQMQKLLLEQAPAAPVPTAQR
ncbi:hypothetical protein [Massilia endophytica]|uniref:hypothetical protein n=1 Tax=Massilia endophytica TaxID=2899220 RepID=UPI001E61C859|nr:hypothetical protein [Massilia endophytica]UGQ46388.1 hypothetical protein LSQ66_21910 [Massilia endophytica]